MEPTKGKRGKNANEKKEGSGAMLAGEENWPVPSCKGEKKLFRLHWRVVTIQALFPDDGEDRAQEKGSVRLRVGLLRSKSLRRSTKTEGGKRLKGPTN